MERLSLAISAVLYLASFFLRYRRHRRLPAQWLLIAAVIIHSLALAARSYTAKHPPFTNLYETLMLLSFLLAVRLIVSGRRIPQAAMPGLTGCAAVLNLAAWLLPVALRTPRPLMPALNSIWMAIHVPAYFYGYMALLFAGTYSLLLLLRGKPVPELGGYIDAEVGIAFFSLNAGLLSGAIWAYQSWGNYWAWDPKETWALINILILGFYFHLRRPTPFKKALLVLIALLSVIFTYWGVSFILRGLHSYTG